MKSQIEKLVTSLEVSKKLKALGIIQESCFYWVGLRDEEDGLCLNEYYSLVQKEGIFKKQTSLLNSGITDTRLILDSVSAFTVTELGMMLDLMTVDPDDDYISHCWPDNQAQMGIFDMLDDYRLPSGKLAFDGMIENLNQNLKEWRDK